MIKGMQKSVGYTDDDENSEMGVSPKIGHYKKTSSFRCSFRVLIELLILILVIVNLYQSQKSSVGAEASSSQQKSQLENISQQIDTLKKAETPPPSQGSVEPPCPEMDFYEIAKKTLTDKVGVHAYYRLYEPYFKPVRCKPVKILEIGIGCKQTYGVGASFYLWLEYFPNAEIYFIEYNQTCAEEWNKKSDRVTVFSGDQSNKTFLHEFIEQTGGNFDFIIDDGGHYMNQQIISLEVLLSASIKPGGVYFLEDLLTSYMPGYGGGGDLDPTTTLSYIKDMISDIMARTMKFQDIKKPLSNQVTRIDCVDELCAFTKKL